MLRSSAFSNNGGRRLVAHWCGRPRILLAPSALSGASSPSATHRLSWNVGGSSRNRTTAVIARPLIRHRRGDGLQPRSSSAISSSSHRYHRCDPSAMFCRALSSGKGGEAPSEGAKSKKKTGDGEDDDDDETKEIVLTPGEQVVVASRLTMWFGIAVFAGFCAYYIGKELIPTKMSPNRVFDRSFDVVRKHDEVKRRYGEPLKAYGRDHGGHREGRRNFVEHTEYVSKDDGSKRTRVRYNLESRFGSAFVFAEVSSDMPSGEFVYILVQDKANGRVLTVVDNRAALTAQRLAAGSKEMQSAMSQLLSGGGGGGGGNKN